MRMKKLLSSILALSLCFSLSSQALAAAAQPTAAKPADPFTVLYEGQDSVYDAVKITHPDKPQSQRKVGHKYADGMVDYLGSGVMGIPGVDEGANGQGDRGQGYTWAAWGYGDYMYVSTCYSAALSTAGLFPEVTPEQAEIRDKVMNALYRGDFFYSQEDGGVSDCVLVKINVKTGDLKIVIDHSMKEDSYGNNYGGLYARQGINPQFRNAVALNGKMYFCGSPGGFPSIWEIDPETDAFRRVYIDPALDPFQGGDPMLIGKAVYEDRLCVAIRGMTVMDGHLIISCVGPDINPYILISKTGDPVDGFNKIASTWDEESWAETMQPHGWPSKDTVKGELFGYPACHIDDAIFGGSIFEMIPFNGDLYVTICTGTVGNGDTYPGNSTKGTLQSFALVRGSYEGDITDRDSWTWDAIIGDEADGAKYPFGIDPERTRGATATLAVLGDHLYIGEYDDVELATIQLFAMMDPQFMADNMEQGINLYRMDKDDNIEMVVGNPTEMFPEGSLTGLLSGFGKDKIDHGVQYIWRMETFQDKLFIGTMDQSNILHPLGQLSNGDLIEMDLIEWADQLQYIIDLVKTIKGSSSATPAQIRMCDEMLEAHAETEAYLSSTGITPEAVPMFLSEDGSISSMGEFMSGLSVLGQMLGSKDGMPEEMAILSMENFIKLYTAVYNFFDAHRALMPGFLEKAFDKLLKPETINKLNDLGRTLHYLSDCIEGFDLFVWDGETMETITRDGMGDPYNHGLRTFAKNEDSENPWLTFGTANSCFGTQVWRLEGEGLNLPSAETTKEYNITVETSDLGVINTYPTTANAGQTVQVTFAPNVGYEAINSKVKDAQGKRVELVENDGLYSFVMPASDVNITTFFNRFVDIYEDSYYMDALEWATENAVTDGMSENFFGPIGICTRAQAITFLWRAAGCPAPKSTDCPFTDVDPNAYYYDAVLWAVENGITKGMTGTSFAPHKYCKRSEIVTFLWNAAGSPAVEEDNHFIDVPDDAYYADAIVWAVEQHITNGTTEATFSPSLGCSRAQVVTFLYRNQVN